MKNILKTTSKFVALLIALIAVSVLPGCNDNPDEYVTTTGSPKVNYVRIPDALSADSLVTHAYMGTTVALIGENLTSIKELWFNDQQAILNNSLITTTALIVPIPNGIPQNITNRIYMINSEGDTTEFVFAVDVPSPIVSSMACEYVPDGGVATIKGNFFLPVDGVGTPVVIFTPNLPATEVVSFSISEIKVKVPAGAQFGHVSVQSRYGTTRSKFYFRDNRGMILDWDNTNASGGWRSGVIGNSNPAGVSGNYVRFQGTMAAESGATWNEDAFSFDLWGTSNGRPQGDLFSSEPAKSVIKFECNVPEAWSSGALQMIFTPWATSGTNGYIGDATVPRGLWIPWEDSGTFKTDGWITVAIPLSNFKYTSAGAETKIAGAGNWGGLTFFVWAGGVNGIECTPHICIDNIRVVPAE